ncbi:hypothetical protein GQ457_06G016660 [Hibiscus cannabinus]
MADVSSDTTEISSIGKMFTNKKVNIVLDETNFLLWKQQVLLTVRSHRLEKLLTGALKPPPEKVAGENGQQVENEAFELFVAQDSALASWLLSTISLQLLPQFVGAETTSQIYIWQLCVLEWELVWNSKKQKIVSRSTMEAEYRSLADATSEIVWLDALLSDMGVVMSTPPVVWSDNSGAIVASANPVYHSKTKHVELDVHFVREKVASNKLAVNYVPAPYQLADGLTKPISKGCFDEFRRSLGPVENVDKLWVRVLKAKYRWNIDVPITINRGTARSCGFIVVNLLLVMVAELTTNDGQWD